MASNISLLCTTSSTSELKMRGLMTDLKFQWKLVFNFLETEVAFTLARPF